ncbi:MAG: DNA repair protein RecO C-terminal domain-containing protein [Moraxella sp.]|nr:DNA repair protein RecO C-terminal domain-containing protein [Moraxella sp.]
MKNTPLTGYLLHARAYQERRAIYRFFSMEHGVVHGVGVRGMPSFVLMELFASGQNSLKNFSQINLTNPPDITPKNAFGQSQYALLYLNEIIIRLISQENPCPTLWQCYHQSVQALHTTDELTVIKCILRRFETVLFDELGVSIDWGADSTGRAIDPVAYYEFVPNQGFVSMANGKLLGKSILAIAQNDGVYDAYLNDVGQIYRTLIDFLLDYRPLNSRKLWAEQLKYR